MQTGLIGKLFFCNPDGSYQKTTGKFVLFLCIKLTFYLLFMVSECVYDIQLITFVLNPQEFIFLHHFNPFKQN